MNALRWMLRVALVGWCTAAAAQTFYKWTDDGGIVHFSDVPPPKVKGVEERNLPAPPEAVAIPQDRSAPVNRAGSAAAAAASVAAAPAATGPAQVVIIARDTPRLSPSAMHVVGEVRNVGAADALNVTVTISAVDSVQGNPCLSQQVIVTPPTLHSGESGKFDIDVDSPCLLGDAHVDVAPEWE